MLIELVRGACAVITSAGDPSRRANLGCAVATRELSRLAFSRDYLENCGSLDESRSAVLASCSRWDPSVRRKHALKVRGYNVANSPLAYHGRWLAELAVVQWVRHGNNHPPRHLV